MRIAVVHEALLATFAGVRAVEAVPADGSLLEEDHCGPKRLSGKVSVMWFHMVLVSGPDYHFISPLELHTVSGTHYRGWNWHIIRGDADTVRTSPTISHWKNSPTEGMLNSIRSDEYIFIFDVRFLTKMTLHIGLSKCVFLLFVIG